MDPLKLTLPYRNICSKAFEKVGKALADEIFVLARNLCTNDIPNGYINTLEVYRPVPLVKEVTVVRPIGIREV